jgi:hypothetical protein
VRLVRRVLLVRLVRRVLQELVCRVQLVLKVYKEQLDQMEFNSGTM